MKALKTWWRIYFRTISDPTYYNQIIKTKLSFSLKYFWGFYLILAIGSSLFFAIRLVPRLATFNQNISEQILSQYPQDLVVSLKNHRLFVYGVDEPFHLAFPTHVGLSDLANQYDWFITLDSQTNTTYDSMFTFNQDQFTFMYPDGQAQTQLYQEFEADFSLDKDKVSTDLPVIQQTVDQIIRLLPLGVFIFNTTLVPLIIMAVLLAFAVFIQIAAQLSQLNISYKKCYQISLHTITFAETARFLQRVLFFDFPVPSIYILAFFGSTLFVIYSLKPVKLTRDKNKRIP